MPCSEVGTGEEVCFNDPYRVNWWVTGWWRELRENYSTATWPREKTGGTATWQMSKDVWKKAPVCSLDLLFTTWPHSQKGECCIQTVVRYVEPLAPAGERNYSSKMSKFVGPQTTSPSVTYMISLLLLKYSFSVLLHNCSAALSALRGCPLSDWNSTQLCGRLLIVLLPSRTSSSIILKRRQTSLHSIENDQCFLRISRQHSFTHTRALTAPVTKAKSQVGEYWHSHCTTSYYNKGIFTLHRLYHKYQNVIGHMTFSDMHEIYITVGEGVWTPTPPPLYPSQCDWLSMVM